MGKGYEIATVYASGKIVVVSATALTLLAFGMAYAMRGGTA